MWQMGASARCWAAPSYFLNYNPGKAPFAEDWFAEEAKRLYGVLDTAIGGPRIHVRRIFDRRHRDLSVDRPP